MSNILNWNDTVGVDNSIEKINTYEYEPHQGTRLNEIGDIRIIISNEDQFILPSESCLYLEGELVPKDGTANYQESEKGIGLVNNGLMYLFNRVDYSVADKKIEGYNNPGRATTMKGLVTYPKVYTEGMNFMWSVDEKESMTSNDKYERRSQFIHDEGNGKFSAMIPLSHIFGFAESYNKIMYGTKHELVLHRTTDTDTIFRSNAKEAGVDKVKKGKINLTKISWYMPIIKLSDESKIMLYKDIQNKTTLPIEFLSRQCESIQMNVGPRHIDWKLSVATGSERPRYVILAFQKNKYEVDTANAAVFDSLDVRNARVEFNGEYIPRPQPRAGLCQQQVQHRISNDN